jgi:hypothetical protein
VEAEQADDVLPTEARRRRFAVESLSATRCSPGERGGERPRLASDGRTGRGHALARWLSHQQLKHRDGKRQFTFT